MNAAPEHPDHQGLQRRAVLVVDDNLTDLDLMSNLLNGFGFEVLVARDGESGLQKARYARPDLILLDVLMPGIDGFEVCRQLKADETTRDIPVIFMTALTEAQDKVQGFQLGAVDYITKPFQHEELLARVTTHLRLRELTERLELKVRERTAELTVANQQLQQEIAERKQAEKALQESEERFRALYDDNPSMYFTVDTGGTVLSVNRFGAEQLGYTVEELTGRSVLDVFYPDDRAAVQRQLAACLQQPGQLAHWEFRKVRKDGSVLWVREAVRVVQRADGQPVLLVVCEDITERKRAEEEKEKLQAQVVRAQKMEAIGRLAGGIAHDFNNMLTVISGRGHFLLSKLSPDDPRTRDAREILQVADRATALTRQLLAFSRRQMLQPQVLDLNALITDIDKMLRRLIGENINLVTVFEADLERVKADLGQMEQVLMNLVVNARDAMPQGGDLIIKTENVILDQEYCRIIPEARPGRFVCLSVADTGTGMEKEILERIFEPFFTTKSNGSGLGLSVVYGIVRQHEGWINAYSEPGQGSVFKIYLPALSTRPPQETERQTPLPLLPGHGEWILLVEDDEQVRALIRGMLEENGYTVLAAASVKEGLDVFRQHGAHIQLVFSDVVLPDGTALELVDQLLSLKEDLRVVLSSGYTNERSQWRIIRERGFYFLPKPYALVGLLKAIREVLDSPPADSNAPPW